MSHNPNSRSLLLVLLVLIMGTALFVVQAWTPQSTQERPAWDVQLGLNAQATSTITIQNECQQTHTFTVTEQKTPYLQLLADATVTVPGNSSYALPVRFNTNGMNAGQYQGNVLVKCDTCRKEKTCKQDREILPLHLVVLRQEGGPQMTPGDPTQPQVPGPPVFKQDKPKATLSPTPTPTPTTGQGPTRPAYGESGKSIKDDKREFDADDQKNYPIEKCAECSVPQVVEDNKQKFIQCGGECIGGDKCPVPGGYKCNLFVAEKQKQNPKDKGLPKWRKVTGGQPRAKPDSMNVYTCACSK